MSRACITCGLCVWPTVLGIVYKRRMCARGLFVVPHDVYIILLYMCMIYIYIYIVCNIMLLRLLCCDDDEWREWGPGARRSLVSWHRGAIERIRGRARCGNVALLSTIVRRNRSPPPIDGDAAATVHRNPAFDRCVCLTPPRTHTHTHTPVINDRRRRRCALFGCVDGYGVLRTYLIIIIIIISN